MSGALMDDFEQAVRDLNVLYKRLDELNWRIAQLEALEVLKQDCDALVHGFYRNLLRFEAVNQRIEQMTLERDGLQQCYARRGELIDEVRTYLASSYRDPVFWVHWLEHVDQQRAKAVA